MAISTYYVNFKLNWKMFSLEIGLPRLYGLLQKLTNELLLLLDFPVKSPDLTRRGF